MVLDWKFWPVFGGLAAIAVAAFVVPASPAYYDTDRAMISEYVPIIHSENGVCSTEYASDGLTKKIMDCSAEVGEVVLIQYEPGQGSAVPITTVESGNAPAKLVITTNNPACTAIFMHDRDGVALQTELRPDPITANSYTAEEIRAGINLTYATTARMAGELMPALVERRDVLSVASYSASDPPELLANATSSLIDDRCVDNQMPFGMFQAVYDVVLQSSTDSGGPGASASSRSSGDVGTAALDEKVFVSIITINSNAEVLAFLEAHGLTPTYVDEPTSTSIGGVGVHGVPVSLLPDISGMDNVVRLEGPQQVMHLDTTP